MKVSLPATAFWALALNHITPSFSLVLTKNEQRLRVDAKMCLDGQADCTRNPDGCCEGLVCSGFVLTKKCIEPPICLEMGHDCGGGRIPCCDGMACTMVSEHLDGALECQPKSIARKTVSFPPADGGNERVLLEEQQDILPGTQARNTRTTKVPGVPVKTNIACSTGDPHIRTFDGLKYDCHGEGEFILAKSNYTAREIQVRYEHMSVNRALSVGKAVAIRDEGDAPIVQVSIPALKTSLGYDMGDGDSCKVQLFVDGVQRDLRDGSGQDDKVTVVMKDKDIWVKYVESEMQVKIRYHRCRLNTCVHLPDTDHTVGVLGTATGDVRDDWTAPDGSVLDIPTSLVARLRKPAYDFCTKNFCNRNKGRSLFTYSEEGLDFEYYQKCDLPYGDTMENFLSDVPQWAVDICKGELQCIMDVQNGDEEDAIAMRKALTEYAGMCSPPGGECDESRCCTGQCVDSGGLAGKTFTQCAPELGSCKHLGCCEGLTCTELNDGSAVCFEERECMDEWMSCEENGCCDGMACLDDQKGGKQCRRLHQCMEKYDDCSMVGCCGSLKCVDNGIGGKHCQDIPDCWDTQGKECSTVPCCECLTCIEENGRNLCRKLPKSVGLGESCKWVPCHEDDNLPLECVDVVDEKGRQDKQCRLVPGDAVVSVWSDVNSNGIQDFNEPGVSGVTLRLIHDKDKKNLFNQGHGGNSYEPLTTDLDGKVHFKRVPRGLPLRVMVVKSPPGAVRTLNNKGDNDSIDSDLLDDGTTNPFRLTEEDTWTKTALGYRMPADLEIRVFNDLDGDGVQGENELGIKGVGIRLTNSRNGTYIPEQGNGGNVHKELITNEKGIVTFTKTPQNVRIRAKVSRAPPGAMPTKGNAGGNDAKDSDLRSDGTSYEFKIKTGSKMTSLDLGYRMPQTVTSQFVFVTGCWAPPGS